MKIDWKFLVTTESRREYIGKRWFKWSIHSDTVIQVTESAGEMKKGRGNLFGITVISKATLFANYIAMGYTESVTRKQYESAFNKIVNILR